MAPKKRGLGMGLDALFAQTESSYENAQAGEEEQVEKKIVEVVSGNYEIDIDKIFPNPNQPRKNFDQVALDELANSIKVHGVIQPIVVNKEPDGRYMIIAGERRYRASLLAGLDAIPAIIKEYSPQKVKEVSIIENLQREDLNPIEAARAIRQLMDEFRFTQEDVAERLGKSRPAIANTLRLLNLNEFVLDLVQSGKMSAGHARTLVVVEDPVLQIDLAKRAVEKEMTVRDFEKMVKIALNPPKKKQTVKQEHSVELKDLVERMQKTFATRVQAVGNDNKGRTYLDYFSKDDLDRISQYVDNLMGLYLVNDDEEK